MKKVLLTTGLSLALLAGGALATQAVGLPIAKAATSSSIPAVQAVPEQADATEVKGTETNDDAADVEVNPADEPSDGETQDN
jgi:hypothetical protein